MNKLLLLDGNSIVNRAFYGIRLLTNSEGIYTNAVYGFLNILFKYMDIVKPTHLCVAFDVSAPTFRHEMYTEYKAKRKGMPEELRPQMPLLKEVLAAMNISQIELAGYEADDLIGTVSKMCEQQDTECFVLTGDKDDLQLASELTKILLVTTRGNVTDTVTYTDKEVSEKYGVTPHEFIHVKALMGDPSDNIPGVPGVGEKTAFGLIQAYKSLDMIYENLDNLKPAVQNKLCHNKDLAYLSYKLSKIDRDVPIDASIDSFCIKEYDAGIVSDLFTRLNFTSFINRLNLSVEKKLDFSYKELAEDDFLSNVSSPVFYSIEPFENKFIVGAGNKVSQIEDISILKAFFESDTEKIGHNIKEDIVLLNRLGISYNNIKFDTMIAAYLVSPERSNYGVDELFLHYKGTTIESASPIERVAANTHAVKELYELFSWELAKNNLADLFYNVEMPLISVLADMQNIGFKADANMLKDFGGQLDIRIDQLTSEIHRLADTDFNINSTKQLGEILFDKLGLPVVKKTKTGYSTDAEVLNKLADEHEIVTLILEYRQLCKLKSTYVDGLLSVISVDDGRIHSSFNQTVTQTGRISSTEPNLQNIPVRTELGREIRRAFVAENPEYILVDADYSQIELRVLAHIAKDPVMIEAFLEGADIHTKTASEVFDVAPSFVTPEMRFRAKAVNFGIVYGIGDFSLAQDLKIKRSEAKNYIEEYLKTYPGVKEYMHSIVEYAKEHGYVTTLLGRRRYVPELKTANFNTRSFGERIAMNTPIQGSAADIIKIAMIRVHSRLKTEKLRSRLILQVHDELIVETYKPELEQVRKILAEEMQGAYNLSVPLAADIGEGESWYDAK